VLQRSDALSGLNDDLLKRDEMVPMDSSSQKVRHESALSALIGALYRGFFYYGLLASLSILAVIFLIGGCYLLVLGGSAYYVLSGFWLCFTTYLFLRRDRTAALLYFVYFLATWIWAFFEVGGFKGWLLLPRVNVVSGMMIVMALPVVLRQLDGNAAHWTKFTTDAAFGRVNQLLGHLLSPRPYLLALSVAIIGLV